MLNEPTVYAVDDDLLTRILLENIFQAANLKVETFSSAEEFLATYSPKNTGCLLLDILMPGMDGLELQEKLAEQGNQAPVIFLSGSDEVRVAVQALKAGAVDFIEKPIQPNVVVGCVNKALELDQKNRYRQLQRSQIKQRITLLTPREAEVMKWIVRGKPNKLIARILGISPRTVEVHRKKVLEKMQVDSVVELVNMISEVERSPISVLDRRMH
jgi:FixJ family two-component response regulator